MTHRKKISEFGRGTKEENNTKIAAFNFEILWEEIGFEKYPKSPFSVDDKFFMYFSKKTPGIKICL